MSAQAVLAANCSCVDSMAASNLSPIKSASATLGIAGRAGYKYAHIIFYTKYFPGPLAAQKIGSANREKPPPYFDRFKLRLHGYPLFSQELTFEASLIFIYYSVVRIHTYVCMCARDVLLLNATDLMSLSNLFN